MKTLGIPSLDHLIQALTKLPGIGQKSAQRLALFILKSPPDYATELMDAIRDVKQKIRLCSRCFNVAEGELCAICNDSSRDQSQICVVEDIVDIMAIEEAQVFRGLYHVLGGVISPLAGVMPEDLHIPELVERVQAGGVKEVLFAINPSTEGEATMIYLSKILKPTGVRLTRIASGVPMGSHLEFLDTATIGRAISTRQDL
ncbi:MAG TPA: recombination protein RecR [Caldithrix abyssi]|uniref:Recombination protein RecR n=1 Tax=Caldithrix abyssi TaxID=187145 RepID=A0A7V5PPA9_CALAY|nr:recombination protein RecR [Caldithrix abyssi]